jgi:hypothetical protein
MLVVAVQESAPGTTRKDFRAASTPSALGGRGDGVGWAERVHFMPGLDTQLTSSRMPRCGAARTTTGTIPVVSMSSALRHSVYSQTLAQLLCDFAEHSTNWMGAMPSDTSLAGAHHDRESTVEELKRELRNRLAASLRLQRFSSLEISRVICCRRWTRSLQRRWTYAVPCR